MTGTIKIEWKDAGFEPRQQPDPRYPLGIDLDMTKSTEPFCRIALPYPAKRCGYYLVECSTCGQKIVITTAGRPDDPRSVKLACKPHPDKVN